LQPLAGTDGLSGLGRAFWSPDSRFIGFPSDGKLSKVDVAGGSPQVVCDLKYSNLWNGGVWSSRGAIVFVIGGGGLFRVPESGGAPVPLIQSHSRAIISRPAFLPDGKHFLHAEFILDAGNSICLGSLDAKPGQLRTKRLMQADPDSCLVYAPGLERGMGHVLFTRKGTLPAQPFGAGNCFGRKADAVGRRRRPAPLASRRQRVVLHFRRFQNDGRGGEHHTWICPRSSESAVRSADLGSGHGNLTRYDVTADGKRFLVNTPAPAPPITVVLNWEEALKK
jgi:hypothetical protein